MRARGLLALSLLAGGCGLLEPGEADRLPGRFRLATYDGRPLPALVQGTAGGARVELVGSELELRRNFRWVLTQQVDTVDERGRRPAVLADSGVFRFDVTPGQLTFFTADAVQHPATVAGDTVDVFWRRARHEVFVRQGAGNRPSLP